MPRNALKSLSDRIRQLQPARLTALLGGFFLFLLTCQLGGLVSTYQFDHDFLFGLVPLFNFDEEFNVPTVFSVGLLLMAGVLLAVIAVDGWRAGGRDRFYWLGLSITFLFLSMDELMSIHETLTDPVRQMLGLRGVLYFSWVIPYGIVVLGLGAAYATFLLRLPRRTRGFMLASAVLFLGGAIGVEMVGAWYSDLQLAQGGQPKDLIYALIVTCEESLEMTGVILFIHTLLTYIRTPLKGEWVPGMPE